jgi:GNAT superfamily N-acetyltransferase
MRPAERKRDPGQRWIRYEAGSPEIDGEHRRGCPCFRSECPIGYVLKPAICLALVHPSRSSAATTGSRGYRDAMTNEHPVYRSEVLADYGFVGTPDDLIEELRNGMQLHRESVSYGIWHALTPEERGTAIRGEAIPYTTPQHEREARLVREFQMLHRAIWVSEGRAVGYMALCDGTDDPATWDGVYETLTNMWVAHAHRRSGVASALLEFVKKRPDVAITRLIRPFSPAGAAWAQAELPHLVIELGRNEPCPCGSGRKYKLCCGA